MPKAKRQISDDEISDDDDETLEEYQERVRREGEAAAASEAASTVVTAKKKESKSLKSLGAKPRARKTPPPPLEPEKIAVSDVTALATKPNQKAIKTAAMTSKPEKAPILLATDDLNSLVRIAVELDTKPNRKSVESRIEGVIALKYPSGELLSSVKNPIWLYEMGAMFRELGYDISMAYLEAAVRESVKPYDLFTGSPLFSEEQVKFRVRIRNLTRTVVINKGAHRCPRCKSQDTLSTFIQVRSGDEGATEYVTCIHCEIRWTAGGG